MIDCGSQCLLCDLPVRFDTYIGCTHGCTYCFVQRNNNNNNNIKSGGGTKCLIDFIKGKRTLDTNWCDWQIPLHWGGMSDPFQPCERQYKLSYEALKVFAETGYPVIISTKGKLCIESPYLELLKKCNVVMQISALCSKYDELEKGAPSFNERLRMIETLSQNVKRVIVRCQPYIHDVFNDVFDNIKLFSERGAFGVTFEGMKFIKKQNGLVKAGADWVQPTNVLKLDYSKFKNECHKNNLKFYCAENRLRKMGDSLTCCGIDGLEDFGFVPNTFNCCHIINNDKNIKITESMKTNGTATVYHSLFQTGKMYRLIKEKSYFDMTKWILENRKEYINLVLKD